MVWYAFFLAYTEPSLGPLLNELHPVRASWYVIGLELGIPYRIMSWFNQMYSNPLDLLREMLKYWLQRAVGPRPTWKAVVTALRSPLVREKNIAARLEEKYCAPVHYISKLSKSGFCTYIFSLCITFLNTGNTFFYHHHIPHNLLWDTCMSYV